MLKSPDRRNTTPFQRANLARTARLVARACDAWAIEIEEGRNPPRLDDVIDQVRRDELRRTIRQYKREQGLKELP